MSAKSLSPGIALLAKAFSRGFAILPKAPLSPSAALAMRLSFLSFALAGALVACGKKEAPPEEAAPATEETAPLVAKEEVDANSEEHADVAAKEDIGDLAQRRRDRLNNRRPAPKGRDADAGESPGEDNAGGDTALKDLKDAKDLPKDLPKDLASDPRDRKVDGNDGNPSATPVSPSAALAGAARDKFPGDGTVPAEGEPAVMPTLGEPRPDSVTGHKAGVTPNPHDMATHPVVGQVLDAVRLMPLTSVLEVTQAKGLVDAGVLPGIATGPGYVSILYRGATADKFGVALQAWQDPARRESDDRFRRMRLQYPNAEDVQVLQPAKAFFSHFSGIQLLTFVDSVKRIVATVACAESICTHEQLTKLAKAVRERL